MDENGICFELAAGIDEDVGVESVDGGGVADVELDAPVATLHASATVSVPALPLLLRVAVTTPVALRT